MQGSAAVVHGADLQPAAVDHDWPVGFELRGQAGEVLGGVLVIYTYDQTDSHAGNGFPIALLGWVLPVVSQIYFARAAPIAGSGC